MAASSNSMISISHTSSRFASYEAELFSANALDAKHTRRILPGMTIHQAPCSARDHDSTDAGDSSNESLGTDSDLRSAGSASSSSNRSTCSTSTPNTPQRPRWADVASDDEDFCFCTTSPTSSRTAATHTERAPPIAGDAHAHDVGKKSRRRGCRGGKGGQRRRAEDASATIAQPPLPATIAPFARSATTPPARSAYAAYSFDRGAFRRGLWATLRALFAAAVDDCQENVAAKVASAAARLGSVPCTYQAAEYADLLTIAAEEQSTASRRVGFAFAASLLAGAAGFERAACVEGVEIFFADIFEELRSEVPLLTNIVSTEMLPPLLAAARGRELAIISAMKAAIPSLRSC